MKWSEGMENLGFDLDGCLYPWHEALYAELVKYSNLTDDYYTFWKYRILDFTERDWEYFCNIPYVYSSIPPRKSLLDYLRILSKKYTIFYVSKRPKSVEIITKDYLREYKFPYYTNTFIVEDKYQIIKDLSLKYYIEDRLEIAREIKDLTTILLINNPWNEGQKEFQSFDSVEDTKSILL